MPKPKTPTRKPGPARSQRPRGSKREQAAEQLALANGATKATPAQLGSVVKAARDIMRKDKGLSGDTDRLPQLTWIMFLKFRLM